MSKRDQLELFTADILAFPLARRASLIRETVDVLWSEFSRARRQRFWEELVDRLEGELRAAGVDKPQAIRMLNAFRSACSRELDRRNAAAYRRPTSGQ